MMMASALIFVPTGHRLSSPISAFLPPRGFQGLCPLRRPVANNPGLGFPRLFSSRGGGRRESRGGSWDAVKKEDAFEMEGSVDLEAEIYEFMQRSANPNDFPTKEELIAASRADLVRAIATRGGWLTFGWDSEEEGGEEDSVQEAAGLDSDEEDVRVSQHRFCPDSWGSNGSWKVDSTDSAPSSSGRSIEMERCEEGGIEGILSRLERERSMSFELESREKDGNGRALRKRGGDDPGYAVGHDQSSKSNSRSRGISVCEDFGNVVSQNGTSTTVNSKSSVGTDMWRLWSLQRTGLPVSDFEAGEIVPSNVDTKSNQNSLSDVSTDAVIHEPGLNGAGTATERNNGHSDLKQGFQSRIQMRLQHLELELSATLQSLRSGTAKIVSPEVQGSSVEELHRLSDAWEFQENEIMNARDKLRSLRAKLAVLEGKVALEIIEAHKIMEEKRGRLDAVQKAVCLLRSACIIWPNPASEVLLAGTFDGWTSQRRMERSSAGVFSLYLKLYPGRYEIKFIVDGIWKTDPLRPTVNNNGHENNLLLIP